MLRRIRTRSTNNIVEEIVDMHKTYGVRGFMCYDDSTEILTKDRGFVLFKYITPTDSVAVLEPLTGEMRFEVPRRIIRKRFDGELITFKGRATDLAVTPEHRMWVRRQNETAYKHVEAHQLLETRERIAFSLRANWVGEKVSYFEIPAYVRKCLGRNKGSPKVCEGVRRFDATTWVAFMAWYLSEGSCYRPRVRNGRGYRICIKQDLMANPEHVREIHEVIRKLGYRYSYSSNQFHIDSKELYEYLKQFGTSRMKHVPQAFKQMSATLILLFLKTYLKGDGHTSPAKQETICSYSPRMRADLQEMALKAGYWAMDDGRRVLLRPQRDTNLNDRVKSFGTQKYSGEVHCVTVSTGIVLVRRGGKASWCGNCYDDELNVNQSMVELMNAIAKTQKDLGTEFRLRGFIKSQLFTDQQAEAMYRAGFRWILVGFESGSERILENINKKANRSENTRCMEIAKRNGLKVKALMSIGHPGESEETIMATRDWLLEVKPDDFDATVITTYPGTPYFDWSVQTKPDTWTYTYQKTGDKLHAVEVDYTEEGGYYKGRLGEYKSYVYTDYISQDRMVELRDFVESDVRAKLNIPYNAGAPGIRYEASMGLTKLPPNILRSTV